jgi:hypothetical protein
MPNQEIIIIEETDLVPLFKGLEKLDLREAHAQTGGHRLGFGHVIRHNNINFRLCWYASSSSRVSITEYGRTHVKSGHNIPGSKQAARPRGRPGPSARDLLRPPPLSRRLGTLPHLVRFSDESVVVQKNVASNGKVNSTFPFDAT